MGVMAGIAPCPAGVLIVVFGAGQGQPLTALFYAFVFSVGMATVLVAIAVAVTWGLRAGLGSSKRLGGLVQVLPVLSGIAILVLGAWLAAVAANRLGLLAG
jgi:cytochrome c biogenesis protein CcdA